MESTPKNDYLQFHNNTLDWVRKQHNLDQPGKMLESIEILEEWIRKQNHFIKKDFPRHRLEVMLIGSKGSIERTKKRLDRLCTVKTVLPKYFGDFDVRSDFKDLLSVVYPLALPKLTDDHIRITLTKAAGSKVGPNLTIESVRMSILFAEYYYTHDYNDGFAFIMDFTELDLMEMFPKLNIMELRDGAVILIEALGVRLKEIHVISGSKILETVVNFVKQVLSDKVNKRIYLHKSIEPVYEFLPRDLLPEEYGGKEKSYKILFEEWMDQLSSEEFRSHQRDMSNAVEDESARSQDDYNYDYMGMHGTFRNLRVD